MYRTCVNMLDDRTRKFIHPRVLRIIRPAQIPCSPKASCGDKEQPKEGCLRRNAETFGDCCIKCK